MTLADQAMGMTAQQATGGKMHVTIELNVQFVSTAHLGEFVEARCEVVRLARTLVFMQSKLCVSARIVASADGHLEDFGRALGGQARNFCSVPPFITEPGSGWPTMSSASLAHSIRASRSMPV